jgi:hypothetical protein
MHERRSFTVFPCHFIFTALLLFFVPIWGSVFNLSSAQAAIAWTPSSGSGNGFDWSNGRGSDKNLFGNPTVTPTSTSNTFSFTPVNFLANSADGKSALTSDSLQFDIETLAGKQIDNILFAEGGHYRINGTGSVKATCSITIQNLDVYQPTPPIEIFNVFEATSDSAGISTWSGSFEVDDIDWSHIRITMSNKLIARSSSSVGSFSWIQKDSLGVNNNDAGIEIIMVPEPATIGILTMGSLAVSAFSRKRSRR